MSTHTESVTIVRSELLALDTLCHGIVTAAGEEGPCCKPATTVVCDGESAGLWPACTWHAHRYGGALDLATIRKALETGAASFDREVADW